MEPPDSLILIPTQWDDARMKIIVQFHILLIFNKYMAIILFLKFKKWINQY